MQRTYQHGTLAERLSMVTFAAGAPQASSYDVYKAHSGVEAITDESGAARATYGYDRSRLVTSTKAGVTASYTYDPFERLDTAGHATLLVSDRVPKSTSQIRHGASRSLFICCTPGTRREQRGDRQPQPCQ